MIITKNGNIFREYTEEGTFCFYFFLYLPIMYFFMIFFISREDIHKIDGLP